MNGDLISTFIGSMPELDKDGYMRSIQGYLEMMQHYNAAIREVRTKLEILNEEFQTKHSYNPIHHIDSRLKKPDSIIKKLKAKGLEMTRENIRENIFDIAGVRVICNYIDDVDTVAALLLKQDDVRLLKKKDYINDPKESGYRSLHIVVEIPVFLAETTLYTPVEVQIRTIAMDFWASLEHQLRYKNAVEDTDELKQKLRKCADGIAELDLDMQDIQREIMKLKPGEGK